MPLPSVLAISSSARGDSHTQSLLDAVLSGRAATVIDLQPLQIGHYEYQQPYDRDDFRIVADALVAHPRLVIVTPVYWYAMSGRLKVMFDRLTDLVTVRKDLGRRLKDHHLFLVACGAEHQLPKGFEVPFRQTSDYFDMHYGGAFYAQTGRGGFVNPLDPAAAAFGDLIYR